MSFVSKLKGGNTSVAAHRPDMLKEALCICGLVEAGGLEIERFL